MSELPAGRGDLVGSSHLRRLLHRGDEVVVLDTLSRHRARANLEWIEGEPGSGGPGPGVGDTRDSGRLQRVAAVSDVNVHLAAQAAVAISAEGPFPCASSRS